MAGHGICAVASLAASEGLFWSHHPHTKHLYRVLPSQLIFLPAPSLPSHPTPSPLPRQVLAAPCLSPWISPFASRLEPALLLLMKMHLPRPPPPSRLLLSQDKELFRFTVGAQRKRSCKGVLFFFSFFFFFFFLLHCKGQSC